MVIRILKWGNSLGLRIPKSFATQAGVEEGSAVDVVLEGNQIVIRPVTPDEYRLTEIVSRICEDNIHAEI